MGIRDIDCRIIANLKIQDIPSIKAQPIFLKKFGIGHSFVNSGNM